MAWKVEPEPKSERTAIAVLGDNANVEQHTKCTTDEEILAAVEKYSAGGCIIGIDAPLVVPNDAGRRICEAELSKMGIHVLPANRDWFQRAFGGCRGVDLTAKLETKGYKLVVSPPVKTDKAVVEVYPTASWKRFFGRIPKFKGVSLEEKRAALLDATILLQECTQILDPPVKLNTLTQTKEDLAQLHGCDLDRYGDALDAVMSAYTVLLWAQSPPPWRPAGDKEHGFILLPPDKKKVKVTATA